MVKADGKVEKALNAISTKAIIALIKNMVMVFLLGPVVIFTKENTKKMKEMGMEK